MKKMNGYLPKKFWVEAKMFQGEVQIALFRVKSGLQFRTFEERNGFKL
jgi:hypothetical protein